MEFEDIIDRFFFVQKTLRDEVCAFVKDIFSAANVRICFRLLIIYLKLDEDGMIHFSEVMPRIAQTHSLIPL